MKIRENDPQRIFCPFIYRNLLARETQCRSSSPACLLFLLRAYLCLNMLSFYFLNLSSLSLNSSTGKDFTESSVDEKKKKNRLKWGRPGSDFWVRKIPWKRDRLPTLVLLGFPGVSVGKESFRSAEDLGLISGLERSLGEGKGYSLQWGLTKSEDIKKRWQEYTEELYKKDLHHPENHDGVITHLEPDILECEVKGLREHHYEQS